MTNPAHYISKVLLLLFFVTVQTFAQEEEKPFTLSAYSEIYYLYNFNKTANNTQPPFIYNFNRSNEVNLNLGFIKAAYNKEKARVNLALMTGTYTQANLVSEPEVLRHIFEANIGVKLLPKNNLWLDAGIFSSHIGFESAIGKDNYNLTRSLMAENSPYYEAGVKLGYTSNNEEWYLSALLLNGWQRIKRPEGNSTPAFGTQITFKPSATITINSSSFLGNDKPDSIRQMRYYHNLYGAFQISKKAFLTTGFDIGLEQRTKGSSQMNTWYTPVLIGKFIASQKVELSARAEYYRDKSGTIVSTNTPNGFQTFGFSANVDYTIQKEVVWRLEARTLKSKDKIFEKRDGAYTSISSWVSSCIAVSL